MFSCNNLHISVWRDSGRRLYLAASFLLACLVPIYGFCAESVDLRQFNVQIFVDDNNPTTSAIVADLSKRIPSARVVLLSDKAELKVSKSLLAITVGPSALRAYLERTREGNIVSTFTSSQAYRAILENASERPSSISAVYSEPSPSSQFQLISLLFKKPVRVGALLSDKSVYFETMLQHAATRIGTALSIETVHSGNNINQALSHISDSPVLVAMPDNTIYNVENVRNILMTTYRRNQALIGFSSALVKAGALASTYSNVPEINEQVVEMLTSYTATGKMPEPQFPKYFRVVVNDDVARSLNLVIDDQTRNFSNKPPAGQQ